MRRLMLVLGAASLLGCGSSDLSGPEAASAVGTWNLATINGAPLPFIVIDQASPPFRVELISDQFVVNADGTWTEVVSFRETDNGTVTFPPPELDTGTWTQSSSRLTVRFSDGTSVNVSVSATAITLAQGGVVSIYQRQP